LHTHFVRVYWNSDEKTRDLLDDNSEQTSKRYISIISCLF
jgi:hypothetical protein